MLHSLQENCKSAHSHFPKRGGDDILKTIPSKKIIIIGKISMAEPTHIPIDLFRIESINFFRKYIWNRKKERERERTGKVKID